MRKTDYIPVGVVALLAGFIGLQIAKAPRRAPAPVAAAEVIAEEQPVASSASAISASVEAGRPPLDVDGLLRMSASAAPVRDLEDIRRRLRMGESGTYLVEALKQLDSSLYRWQDRMAEPIRVWIAPAPSPNSDELTRLVRQSFDPWTNSGIPIRFTFVLDSADADVKVTWIERFDVGNRLGHAKVVYDQYRWLNSGAEITLAIRYPQGQPVSNSLLLAIAQHEVGHLLGLAHSADSADIMFPTVYARGLSSSDVNTVRLVYSVAAGSIK
jgi:hypothetical protein